METTMNDARLQAKAAERDARKAQIIGDLEDSMGTDGVLKLMQETSFKNMQANYPAYRLRKAMHREHLQDQANRLNAAGVTYLQRAKGLLLRSTSAMSYVM